MKILLLLAAAALAAEPSAESLKAGSSLDFLQSWRQMQRGVRSQAAKLAPVDRNQIENLEGILLQVKPRLNPQRVGMKFDGNGNRVEGVVIGSSADQAGVRGGDAVVEINGEDTRAKTTFEIVQLIARSTGTLVVAVERQGQTRKVSLEKRPFRDPAAVRADALEFDRISKSLEEFKSAALSGRLGPRGADPASDRLYQLRTDAIKLYLKLNGEEDAKIRLD